MGTGLVIIKVVDGLSALPPAMRETVHRIVAARAGQDAPEPAVVALARPSEVSPGLGLVESQTWLVALGGGPVSPGHIVASDGGWVAAGDAVTVHAGGAAAEGRVQVMERLGVVGGDEHRRR